MQPNNQQQFQPNANLSVNPAGAPNPQAPQLQPQSVQPPVAPGQPQPAQPGQQPQQQQQQQNTQQNKKQAENTQNTLLFSEMRENMIIMNDGSFRSVVRCQSINFDLMSIREREAIEFSYQNFINSLYFPVQILVRSRRVDITPYINRLLENRRNQDNMLLDVLMGDYIDFIDILAQEANIMDKSFYIIVPYYPAGDVSAVKQQAKGLFDSFFGGTKAPTVTKIDQVAYEKAKDEIKNRIDLIMSGLFQLGVKSSQLNTQQLGELFYNSYNPDISSREPLTANPSELTTTFVRKGRGDTLEGAGGQLG